MAGWTDSGKYMVLGTAFPAVALQTNYYVILCTSAASPTKDTTTFAALTELAYTNVYPGGGFSITRGGTDFEPHTLEGPNDRGLVQLKDIVWTASGGPIPNTGDGARWAVLTDDEATVNNRTVYIYWDLSSDRSVSDGQTLTLQDCEIQINET